MRTLVAAALSLLLAGACSKSESKPPITVDNHGCDHLQYGPYPNVAGGADHAAAGEAHFHSASKVVLEANKSVYIKFDSTLDGEYGVFSDNASLEISLEDASGKAIAPKLTADKVDVCTQVKRKQLYDLEPALVFYLKLTLDSAATVTVVLVPPLVAEGDGGHHAGDGGHGGDAHGGDAHSGDAHAHDGVHAGDAQHGG